MKMIFVRTVIISLILLGFISGCKKPADIDPIDNNLLGKWTLTESKIGIAGPGQWLPVAPPNPTIEFKADGSFITSEPHWTSDQYRIVDSSTIKFLPVSNSVDSLGYFLMGYSIDITGKELLMYNVLPGCIEGCEFKYRRQSPD